MTRLRAILTAGGTREPVDDVRVLTNSSTGRFGAALANALVARGVEVDLLASTALASHPEWLDPRVRVHPYTSHQSLESALTALCSDPVDLLLMAAAVSDYRPVPTAGKIRSTSDTLTLHLEKTPKILASLREQVGADCTLVGFKLLSGVSTEELVAVAQGQRRSAALDFTVANDLATFAPGLHPVQLVGEHEVTPLTGSKAETAAQIIDHLLEYRRPGGPEILEAGTCAALERAARAAEAQGLGPVTLAVQQGDAVWVRAPDGTTHAVRPGPGPDQGIAALAAVAATLERVAVLTGPVLGIDLPELDAPLGYPEAGRALCAAWFEACATGRAAGQRFLAAVDGRALGVMGEAPQVDAPRFDAAVLAGQERVGQLVHHDGAVSLWLDPALASPDLEDQVFAALDRAGTPLQIPQARLLDFTQRGCKVLEDHGATLRLQLPSQRDDLQPAVSVCVVDWSTRSVLLGQRKTAPWAGTWSFPGGRLEPGEAPLAGALRELSEETGLTLRNPHVRQVIQIPVATENGQFAFLITHLHIAIAHSGELRETQEFAPRWVPLDQLNMLSEIPAGTRRGLRLIQLRDDNA